MQQHGIFDHCMVHTLQSTLITCPCQVVNLVQTPTTSHIYLIYQGKQSMHYDVAAGTKFFLAFKWYDFGLKGCGE